MGGGGGEGGRNLLVCLSAIVFLDDFVRPCGNFRCFTRLPFDGECMVTTVRRAMRHVDKALSGSVIYT